MNETTITMTVPEARRRLSNTGGMSSEQVSDLQEVIDQFYEAQPRKACAACHCQVWAERSTKDGNAVWCCGGCGRPASLTAEEWHAQRQAAEAVRKVQDAAAAAAAPDPRAVLQEALAARSKANAEVVKLDRAVPIARATLVDAQVRHDRAVANAEAVNAHSAENLATTFYNGGTKPPDSARTAAAARGELTAAADALVIAKNARAILDDKVKDARAAVGFANDRARKAARGVIVAERLEPLLAETAEARATYLEGVSRLAWLIQQHAVPQNDARPRQLVADANTPPSAWPEAKTAGVQPMEAALTALMADPEAVV